MKIRRVDFSPDEWIAGTVGMTLEEEGLYIRVCALIYSHGGPIGMELLKRACQHDHGNRVNACLARLVAMQKLIRNGLEIDQKRCRNELEKALIRAGKGREKEPEYSSSNDLESPRARTHARNHQPSTKGSDLSGLKAKEGSEPSRTRAREGAWGASLASPAPNHQSEAAAEAEREARRQRGLQEALAELEVWKAAHPEFAGQA